MPYSKPISKQQLLLPERKNFIRLSLINQRDILERLSVDNLIRYLYYIIIGDPNIDGIGNSGIGDENVRLSTSTSGNNQNNNFRFTPEGHYLVEQIADDHNYQQQQQQQSIINGGSIGVGGYKRFQTPFIHSIDNNNDISNRLRDDAYVLDWIAKHPQPQPQSQQQSQQQQQPLSMIFNNGNGTNIMNAGAATLSSSFASSWTLNDAIQNQNGLCNNNVSFSPFSIDNNSNNNNNNIRSERIELVDLNPLSSSSSQSSSSSTITATATSSSMLLNNQFQLNMEPTTTSTTLSITSNNNNNNNIGHYPIENHPLMMISNNNNVNNVNNNNSMINLERKDTQMFDSFCLPSPIIFNRMTMDNRNRLLSTLPSQVKNKYEFYCWSSNQTNTFFNGDNGIVGGDDNGI